MLIIFEILLNKQQQQQQQNAWTSLYVWYIYGGFICLKSVAKKEQSNASSKIKKTMKHTHEHNLFLSLLTISPSVSLMKAECVGEGSRDAWLHTVNPPEQHSCTFQVRAHTHTDFRVWALWTWLQVSPAVSLSHCLHFSLSVSQMQMWTFPSDSPTQGSLSLAYCRHRVMMGLLLRQGRGTLNTSLLI